MAAALEKADPVILDRVHFARGEAAAAAFHATLADPPAPAPRAMAATTGRAPGGADRAAQRRSRSGRGAIRAASFAASRRWTAGGGAAQVMDAFTRRDAMSRLTPVAALAVDAPGVAVGGWCRGLGFQPGPPGGGATAMFVALVEGTGRPG